MIICPSSVAFRYKYSVQRKYYKQREKKNYVLNNSRIYKQKLINKNKTKKDHLNTYTTCLSAVIKLLGFKCGELLSMKALTLLSSQD